MQNTGSHRYYIRKKAVFEKKQFSVFRWIGPFAMLVHLPEVCHVMPLETEVVNKRILLSIGNA